LHGFFGEAPIAERPQGEAVQLGAVRGVYGADAVVTRQDRTTTHHFM
jgi:hypothetical protein